jgi:hypothetical protein
LRLHAQKVLQFKDVEASLLRYDIERIVNNPNLGTAEMRDLARRPSGRRPENSRPRRALPQSRK